MYYSRIGKLTEGAFVPDSHDWPYVFAAYADVLGWVRDLGKGRPDPIYVQVSGGRRDILRVYRTQGGVARPLCGWHQERRALA